MSFYERYEGLCQDHGMKPQNPKRQEIVEASSGTISGWKKGVMPKTETVIRIAKYFGVTTDYLLCLSDSRNGKDTITEEEQLLISAYRSASTEGKFIIIQTCMNQKEASKSSAV
jgi:transcriptional regulator with XRE-family HTH domain